MPKRTLGPFTELQRNVLADLEDDPTDNDLLERMHVVNAALAANSCNCNGHSVGSQRDPYFGADLSELVTRSIPHTVKVEVEGRLVERIERVHLSTLRVEVDSNNEVCVWIYEES